MPNLSPLEILVVAAIALIVFGPQKLPEIARTIGRAMSELRRMAAEVRSEFDMGLTDVEDEDETPPPARTRPQAPPTAPAEAPTDEIEAPASAEAKPPAENA